jgi:hypothetical protein
MPCSTQELNSLRKFGIMENFSGDNVPNKAIFKLKENWEGKITDFCFALDK